MKCIGTMKSYNVPLIVLLLMTIAYLFFTRSKQCFRDGKPAVPYETPAISGHLELEGILEAASMEDKRVILTYLDHQNIYAASILNLFLESFRLGIGTKRYLNHLIIISTEARAFHYCNSVHPHCYLAPSQSKRLFGGSERMMEWRRNELLQEVIELGYSLIYTDLDVLWFRNPFPQFSGKESFAIARKASSSTLQSGMDHPDGGFFFMKSDAMAVELLKLWNMARVLYPNSDAWSTLEIIMQQDWIQTLIGMQIKFLDTAFFSSFCEGAVDLSTACTVHGNCCAESECQIRDLQLLLSHWKNFTALSAQNSGNELAQ